MPRHDASEMSASRARRPINRWGDAPAEPFGVGRARVPVGLRIWAGLVGGGAAALFVASWLDEPAAGSMFERAAGAIVLAAAVGVIAGGPIWILRRRSWSRAECVVPAIVLVALAVLGIMAAVGAMVGRIADR